MPETHPVPSELSAFAARGAGSDSERRAAVHLRDRLRAQGRTVELQAIDVWPRVALARALYAALAVAGSVTAVSAGVVGTAMVGAALLLALLDALGLAAPLRRALGRRASQNVESREDGGRRGTLILLAGYDAPRESGALTAAARVLRDPALAMLVASTVVLACCGLRVGGIDPTWLTAVQFVPTVLMILLVPALLDVELSPAGDDPRGAAAARTVLDVAEELGGRLEHFDLWVLLAGASGTGAQGAAAWLRRGRKQLDRTATAVVAVGPIGDGGLRFTRREGEVLPSRCHRDLVRLAGEVAEDSAADGRPAAAAVVDRRATNASRATARGLPAITVSAAGDGPPDRDALESAASFVRELVARLDREVGPSLDEPG